MSSCGEALAARQDGGRRPGAFPGCGRRLHFGSSGRLGRLAMHMASINNALVISVLFVINSAPGSLAQSDYCASTPSVYFDNVNVMERTCRFGPQPPRYHSCNDQREHIKIMSQNLLRCPGIPQGIRNAAAANARRLAGAVGDRRGPGQGSGNIYNPSGPAPLRPDRPSNPSCYQFAVGC
jgi:hypothetical protein